MKVGMQHWAIEYYQVCSSDNLDLFTARSNFVPYAFVGEEGKTMDFSETIVIYDIKVCRCSQLNEYMKFYEYQSSRSFTDHGSNLSDWIYFNFISSVTTRSIEANFHLEPPWDRGTKDFIQTVQVTWLRWPPCLNMVKSCKNLLLWNQKGW